MAKLEQSRGAKPEAPVEQSQSPALEGTLGTGREAFGPSRSAAPFSAGINKGVALVNNKELLASCVALENLPDAARYMKLV